MMACGWDTRLQAGRRVWSFHDRKRHIHFALESWDKHTSGSGRKEGLNKEPCRGFLGEGGVVDF